MLFPRLGAADELHAGIEPGLALVVAVLTEAALPMEPGTMGLNACFSPLALLLRPVPPEALTGADAVAGGAASKDD